ncbi:MAG: 50S ribosomal protein L31 [Patescibacteria group bacterium]
MKKDIHPTYYPEARVHCACGNTFTIGSTKESIETDACSACHPFYTGQDKLLDRVGQIQKFRKRLAQKEVLASKSPKTPTRKTKKKS